MRGLFLTLMFGFLTACGTIRYQIKSPTDSRHGVETEVQWDVITINFNKVWGDSLKAMWDKAWH